MKYLALLMAVLIIATLSVSAQLQFTYKIVDTGQDVFFDNTKSISTPETGAPFYGQDAQFLGNQPSYTDNGDGTVTDNVTGLMWTQTADINEDGVVNYQDKMTYPEIVNYLSEINVGGYNDWRIPKIKELYSLINFNGLDPSGWEGTDVSQLIPFIDDEVFGFGFGDVSADERIIDAQFATNTFYVGEAMFSNSIMFGVNFADGRIKGYPTDPMPNQNEGKKFYVLFVRGYDLYGRNEFVDNGDGTITDEATGLMWSQNDNGSGLNWEDALSWVQEKNAEGYLGFSDWRMPNVKELQSIVDYELAPQTTSSPALDLIFNCTPIMDESNSSNWPFFWSSTTHENMQSGSNAAYVAFGEALGYMMMPPNSGNYILIDVHGAGAQRSDPKDGDPADYPHGHGPQGDVIRIYNYVRLVRDLGPVGVEDDIRGDNFMISPNPASEYIEITLPDTELAAGYTVYNMYGQTVLAADKAETAGRYRVDISSLPSGVYYIKIANTTESFIISR